MSNSSAFRALQYDDNIRRVIPFYDEIYRQIFSLIHAYFGSRPLSVLDTGCGTGHFGCMAQDMLSLSELVLCDPSAEMLAAAADKLKNNPCQMLHVGSESLPFENRFDVVTAIQSHHYFDKAARKTAVSHCFRALRPNGLFICFENTAPDTSIGKKLMLRQLEEFEYQCGRSKEEIQRHSNRYGSEFFPITINDHLSLLRETGFSCAELFWHTYMQSGFYAIKS